MVRSTATTGVTAPRACPQPSTNISLFSCEYAARETALRRFLAVPTTERRHDATPALPRTTAFVCRGTAPSPRHSTSLLTGASHLSLLSPVGFGTLGRQATDMAWRLGWQGGLRVWVAYVSFLPRAFSFTKDIKLHLPTPSGLCIDCAWRKRDDIFSLMTFTYATCVSDSYGHGTFLLSHHTTGGKEQVEGDGSPCCLPVCGCWQGALCAHVSVLIILSLSYVSVIPLV